MDLKNMYRRQILSDLVFISISILSQDCRELWFLFQFLLFEKNTYKEGVGGTSSCAREYPSLEKWAIAGSHYSAWRSGMPTHKLFLLTVFELLKIQAKLPDHFISPVFNKIYI